MSTREAIDLYRLFGYAAAMGCLETYLTSWRTQKMDQTIRALIEGAIRQVGLQQWQDVKALVQTALKGRPDICDAIVAEAIENRKPPA